MQDLFLKKNIIIGNVAFYGATSEKLLSVEKRVNVSGSGIPE